jgi:sialidase-1
MGTCRPVTVRLPACYTAKINLPLTCLGHSIMPAHVFLAMLSCRLRQSPALLIHRVVLILCLAPWGTITAASEPSLQTAAGKPAEAELAPFLGEPLLEAQVLFEGGNNVREPYLAIAVDGSMLAMRNYAHQLRRSTDGGRQWGEIVEVPFGFLDSNLIVDENTGDIMTVRLWDGQDRLWRSRDHGQTWQEEPVTLKPNELMKWLEQSGLKTRGTRSSGPGTYFLHANASEPGVTLRHGKYPGRLLVTATFRPQAEEHPSDREPVDAIYSCAIYSDDGGATWQVSGLFPEGYTEEAALVELHDGRIYFNSRSNDGFYDPSRVRELPPEAAQRRTAWSYDGGNTWEDLEINRVLSDGGGLHRGYGMKGGLVRLPVKDRDILLYSNADTQGGPRERLTIWASFDGGRTWPVKRLVTDGPSAYSTLAAGRPGTNTEGTIFLLFEGVEAGMYRGMQLARLNLSWVLEGERTGDGDIPPWITR